MAKKNNFINKIIKVLKFNKKINLKEENKSINEIKTICINWNKKFKKIALQSVLKRENYARSFKDFAHCLISIFFPYFF